MSDEIPLNGTSEDDILEDAFRRFKRCQDRERNARENIRNDMMFAEGDSRNNYQWPSKIATDRELSDKPTLTNNLVRQHNLQIVNDARQHKPGIEIRATGSNATYEAAKVWEGLVRNIEYHSDAQDAYDTATYHQVYGGIGYWRVVTEYADSGTFDLDIFIRRVPDPHSIYLDPDIQQYDGSDAAFGFVFTDLERREFKRRYPEHADASMTPALMEIGADWMTEDKVRVAEYYRKVEKADRLFDVPEGIMPSLPQGGVVKASEVGAEIAGLLKELGLRSRKVSRAEVEHYKIAGGEIIERSIWPGKFVPIVRVVGEETVIDGELDRKGHTRSMISAQQMHNYFYSAAVEHVALQTKSPYIADVRSIEGYESYWNNANNSNFPYLPYNAINSDDGRPIEKPSRAEPPQMAAAFIQGLNVSSQLVMDVSGQHQASLGEPSNEKSGVAIQQRQRQGDNATAHYIDHQAQAVRFTGRILIDLIPKVYDTKRVFQILEPDGTRYKVAVDPQAPAPHQQMQKVDAPEFDETAVAAIFNPNMGDYAVVADIGPSFATKRQDAFNALTQIMQNNQELMKVAGDLLFRQGDFPGADELAERLRRTIPPQLLSDDQETSQLAQMKQQADQMMEHGKQLLSQADQEITDLRRQLTAAQAQITDKTDRARIDDYRAETDRMKAVGAIDPVALVPIIREQVSQMMGMPALPVIQAHQVEDQMHDATLQAASAQMQAAAVPPQPSPTDSGAQTNQAGPG